MNTVVNTIRALGAPLGVMLNPDFMHGTTGGSIDSHRLLALVRRRRGSAAVVRLVEAIFSSIFEFNQDVANLGVLAKLAADQTPWGTPVLDPADRIDLGMTEDEILYWLHGDEFRHEVTIGCTRLPAGIKSTPTFAVQGKYLIGGYQDPSVFVKLFERIEAQGGPSP
jgi:predicted DsbA family dithiol-disulfide isomerase